MIARSAGLLVFRRTAGDTEVLLGHMGGPFWAAKDAGAWTVPKGLVEDGEDPLAAARREFVEELGLPVPAGELFALGEVRASRGKIATVWAVEGDLDPGAIDPGTFELEWPPRSGRTERFPEIDRAGWFTCDDAAERIVAGQRELLTRLATALGADRP